MIDGVPFSFFVTFISTFGTFVVVAVAIVRAL